MHHSEGEYHDIGCVSTCSVRAIGVMEHGAVTYTYSLCSYHAYNYKCVSLYYADMTKPLTLHQSLIIPSYGIVGPQITMLLWLYINSIGI